MGMRKQCTSATPLVHPEISAEVAGTKLCAENFILPLLMYITEAPAPEQSDNNFVIERCQKMYGLWVSYDLASHWVHQTSG